MNKPSKVHGKDPKTPTKGRCGEGKAWKTSIALAEDIAEVTCRRCLALFELDKEKVGRND
jgi:transcription elongation factor Elf1